MRTAPETKSDNKLMEKVTALCKRRGFIFPGSEIYGGLANSWDYGPYGVELKNNIKKAWWESNVYLRNDIYGMDAAIIMHPRPGRRRGMSRISPTRWLIARNVTPGCVKIT
jgi:hypothetical protein